MNWTFKQIYNVPLIMAVIFCAQHQAHAVGANTPFASVEAESGTLGGGAAVESLTQSLITSGQSSPQLEASGHAYVQLTGTGQSVGLVNNTGGSITALNVRYCIPDSTGGGGITATLDVYVNGTFRQAITLNSMQTWCYEANIQSHGWSQIPSSGSPHIFWDEIHFFLSGAAVPAGATITFQKDSANTAAFYYLDVIDMEKPAAPLSQPANSISIISYGAVSNNPSVDSTAAIQNCINACQTSGKIVWIPPGTYYLNQPAASLSASGVTIQGAGMWYSTIYANPTLPDTSAQNILYPTSCTVQDLLFDSNSRSGGSGDGNGGGLNVKGNNWVVNRVWIQHLGAGIWADGNNGLIENCRSGCTWADGINVNNGNGGTGNNAGNFLTVSNCFVRGSGDDGFALNSGNNPGGLQMTNATVINCSSVAPWWANNIGIYGGVNILVSNNFCSSSVDEFGISIGQFGGSAGLPLQSGLVADNVLQYCGCYFDGPPGEPALQIGQTDPISDVTVSGNTIEDSVLAAVGVDYCGNNVIIENNYVDTPGTTGFLVESGATGSPEVDFNIVQNVGSGQSVYVNDASSFSPVMFNNTWQPSAGIVPVTAGAIYRLVCASSGLALDNTGSTTAGTGVWQWTPTLGNENQEWETGNAGGGHWNLLCQTSDMNLDNGGSTTVGTEVTQWTPNPPNDNQNWEFMDEGGGYYSLICETSGMYLDNGGSTADGLPYMKQWTGAGNLNQLWNLEVLPISGHYYHLICASSDMAMDNGGSTTAGSDVVQYTDQSGNNNQLWELVSVGGGYYNLVCQTSGMTLDNGGSTTAGTPVTQYTIGSGNINQYWQLVDAGGGYFNLICEKSGMYLDNGGSTSNSTNLKQWGQANNANQLWRFEFVR